MFESDDFDQVLSQFDFPEDSSIKPSPTEKENTNGLVSHRPSEAPLKPLENISQNNSNFNDTTQKSSKNDDIHLISTRALSSTSNKKDDCFVSPKHMKRKIINSHFDHTSKRKFPGPAGLLSGTQNNDDNISHMELSSQDIEYTSQHCELFQSPLWLRLLDDVKHWDIGNLDSIAMIKEQAVAGNLPKRARTVVAFIEAVDRSGPHPFITLRDSTGNIKCTLHKDVWSIFNLYMVSEYCALVLLKPPVAITRKALKKHYLNITLSNIYAIYSSAVIKDEDVNLPEGYTATCEDNFTVIKKEKPMQNDTSAIVINKAADDSIDELDELESIFSDDVF